MGKRRVIAETGAGQHGVATATACALLGLECVVYMGTEDMRRQRPNVERMELLGATVEPVEAGARTLKEAVSAAIRDWVTNVETTHYVIGSAVGPAPYPALVRDLQRVIGDEARAQMLEQARAAARPRRRLRRRRQQRDRHLHRVRRRRARSSWSASRPAGEGLESGRHGASLGAGQRGRAARRAVVGLQDADGQIVEAHSVSAGLDYPGVGPEHAHLRDTGRVRYESVTDDAGARRVPRALAARGHHPGARAGARDRLGARQPAAPTDAITLVTLSGRGDKDLARCSSAMADGGPAARRRADRRAPSRRTGKRAALMPYLMGGFPDLARLAARRARPTRTRAPT